MENPIRSLEHVLGERILAQEPALHAIMDAFAVWEMDRESATSNKPLVMAFTGPTGVGKTETAMTIADAIFKSRDRLKSGREIPRGLLVLRGESYSEKDGSVASFRADIRERLMNHFDSCSGNALVVFDEVQKVAAGTLDAISGVLDTGELTRNTGNGVVQTVRADNAIFILISDIGSVEMVNYLIARHGDALAAREMIPQPQIRQVVRSALDEQWERLRFGKIIKSAVPFLPLTPHNIADVARLKLEQLGEDMKGRYWSSFEFSDEVPRYFALPTFVDYRFQGHESYPDRKHVYATYGARAIVNGGPMDAIKPVIFRKLRRPRGGSSSGRADDTLPRVDERHVKLMWTLTTMSPSEYRKRAMNGGLEADVFPLELHACQKKKKKKTGKTNGQEDGGDASESCEIGDCVVVWRGTLRDSLD